MRSVLLVALVPILGCAKPTAPPAPTAGAVVAAAPASNPHETDAEAFYGLEAACASLEEARDQTEKLVAAVGDEAGEALRDVLGGLNAAGEDLSDPSEPPEGRPYSEAERKAVVQAAADALGELNDVGDILDNLAQNVPPAHERALAAVRTSVDEAIDAVESALDGLGGTVAEKP